MQKRTLTQIKKALQKLSEKGWIKSNRLHNTGIGKTLEDYLGITENNIALPDFGVMELKSQRLKTLSMMTLFTKSPEGITNAEIRKRFGYPDPEFPKIKILHQTISGGKRNGMGFQATIDEKQGKLLILKKGKLLGYYSLTFLRQKAVEKIGFTCENIVVRNIPGKRMPIKNSPTNIVGALEETMNKESIVVLRKN